MECLGIIRNVKINENEKPLFHNRQFIKNTKRFDRNGAMKYVEHCEQFLKKNSYSISEHYIQRKIKLHVLQHYVQENSQRAEKKKHDIVFKV